MWSSTWRSQAQGFQTVCINITARNDGVVDCAVDSGVRSAKDMTDPDTTASWASAQSFSDLAAATVSFLEGHLQQTPIHLGPLNTETAELVPALIGMNRAGFITTDSQPGQLSPPSSAQRAYVEGFCDEATAATLSVNMV